jgi:glutamate carboxypeptidase
LQVKKFRLIRQRIIIVYFTGDEERAGLPISVSRKDFITRAQQCDVALGFETANISTARRLAGH